MQTRSFIHSHRQFTTSVLTPESGEGAFPSHLLSNVAVAASERTIGKKDILETYVSELAGAYFLVV